jgi:hypothetical protein
MGDQECIQIAALERQARAGQPVYVIHV